MTTSELQSDQENSCFVDHVNGCDTTCSTSRLRLSSHNYRSLIHQQSIDTQMGSAQSIIYSLIIVFYPIIHLCWLLVVRHRTILHRRAYFRYVFAIFLDLRAIFNEGNASISEVVALGRPNRHCHGLAYTLVLIETANAGHCSRINPPLIIVP